MFVLPTPCVCMPCAGEKFGKQMECSPHGTGAARSVGEVAECWIRLGADGRELS